MKTQVFKPYVQNQTMLLPPDLNEMIPEKHLVRVVNEMIDQIDKNILIQQYKGGGTSAYDPVMMLKVVVYAITQGIFSSRKIAKALRENIHFMWLSGMNKPDHRTINRFRSVTMINVVDEVFYEVIEQLDKMGYINLEECFTDGTKLEANANRYSFVWRKSTAQYKASLQEKVERLLEEMQAIDEAEDKLYGEGDLAEMGEGKEINSEEIKKAAEKINQRLRSDPENKTLQQAKRKLEKDYLPRMKKYERYEKILEERNNFSKTDHDATFMRMKEDHMRNGQLKPGYNIQMSTQNQFVMTFSLHRRAGDTSCLKEHLQKHKQWLGRYPKNLIADAGYGSEENYSFLAENGITAYVKYNSFHYEQKRNYKKKKPYRAENFIYHPEADEYECPQGKRLRYQFTKPYKSENGFASERRIYECADCEGCPVKAECTRSKYNRRIQIGVRLELFKRNAVENLNSKQGLALRSKRPIEVESVFGRIKQDWGFRRFLLRGIDKVSTEWGLMCIAHNIAKVAAR